jgi:histidinol dehydrogenase
MWLLKNDHFVSSSQVVLVALPGVDLDAVQGEVDRQCDALPRGSTAREALSHSCIVRVDSKVGAWAVAQGSTCLLRQVS